MSTARRSSTRRVLGLGSAGLLFLGGSLLAGAGAAHADDAPTTNQNSYSLSAEGDGMFFDVTDNQLPATTDVAVSPYSAQASLDSNANSTAFAGLPYLGPIVETIGGTVNGLSGGATPPIPPAPGYVTTSYPQSKTANETQGPYLIQANSAAYESDASAGSGISPQAGSTNQQVFSKAKVVANPDGSVEATASAGVDGLNIGPIDGLNVSTLVDIVEKGTGDPKISQAENLGTFTVLGFTIGITQSGFNVLGDNLPLPTQTILSAVNTALTQSGIQIAVIPSTTHKDDTTGGTTVSSGGLQIITSENVPTQGPTTFTYTYGRATVVAADVDTSGGDTSTDGSSTDSSATTTAPTDTTGTTAPATDTSGTTPVDTGSTTTAAGDAGGTAAVGDTGSLPAASDAGSLPTDTSGTTPVVAGSDPSTAIASGGPVQVLGAVRKFSNAAVGTNSRGLYLVLVLAGLAALGGQQLFRNLGVRLFLHAR